VNETAAPVSPAPPIDLFNSAAFVLSRELEFDGMDLKGTEPSR
jgi:hypothetical protein